MSVLATSPTGYTDSEVLHLINYSQIATTTFMAGVSKLNVSLPTKIGGDFLSIVFSSIIGNGTWLLENKVRNQVVAPYSDKIIGIGVAAGLTTAYGIAMLGTAAGGIAAVVAPPIAIVAGSMAARKVSYYVTDKIDRYLRA